LSPENLLIEIAAGFAFLSWDPVTGANSYKVYATDDPDILNWGEPVAIVGEPGYSEEITENMRFYRVIASSDTNPAMRRYQSDPREDRSRNKKE